jgi:hypothetical protein
MKLFSRFAKFAFTAALVLMASRAAGAQDNQRGQPKTPVSPADFAKLKWMVGSWKGTSAGETTLFERIRFTNDSTIDMTFFADSLTGRQTGVAKVNLSVGRVYYTLGPGRWGATRVDANSAYFVPQVNAHNTYNWVYQSNDVWTSTMRTGMGGKDRTTVYQMQRIAP